MIIDLVARYIIFNYFQKFEELSIPNIKKLLEFDNIEIDDNKLKSIVNDIHIKEKKIERIDYLGKNSIYKLLDEKMWGREGIDNFYSLSDKDCIDKSILLISDLHLGNKEYEDYNLINLIYEKAKSDNINSILILGDLFDKSIDDEIKLKREIDKFNDNYPDIKISSYALIGNHEKKIKYDFRNIMVNKRDFNFINRENILLKVGNDYIHLSHKLYLNIFYNDIWLNNEDDFEKTSLITDDFFEKNSPLYEPEYKINILGHFHNAFIKTIKDKYLFIGVPSLSKINNGKCVSYKVNLHYKENDIEQLDITPIYYLDNELIEQEKIEFKSKNKVKKLAEV